MEHKNSAQTIFKRRRDWPLIGITALFVVLLLGTLAWSVNFLAASIGAAIGGKSGAGNALEFKVDDAKKILNARGISPQ